MSILSFIESVEEELCSSTESKIFKCMDYFNCKDLIDYNNTNEIINLDIEKYSECELLKFQTIVCGNLRKSFKKNNTDDNDECIIEYNDLICKLNWLIETSKYLSDKIGLPIFKHNENSNKGVSRSSYKFCNFYFECQFNYNVKKHNGCFAQHYVHNLVYADLLALRNYVLVNKNNNTNNEINKEIKKTINTLSFVINHMYEELKNAQKFNFFNINNQHIERKPVKRKGKHTVFSLSN